MKTSVTTVCVSIVCVHLGRLKFKPFSTTRTTPSFLVEFPAPNHWRLLILHPHDLENSDGIHEDDEWMVCSDQRRNGLFSPCWHVSVCSGFSQQVSAVQRIYWSSNHYQRMSFVHGQPRQCPMVACENSASVMKKYDSRFLIAHDVTWTVLKWYFDLNCSYMC